MAFKKLRNRVYLAISPLLLLLVGLVIWALFLLNTLGLIFDEVSDRNYRFSHRLDEATLAASELQISLNLMVLGQHDFAAQTLDVALGNYTAALEDIDGYAIGWSGDELAELGPLSIALSSHINDILRNPQAAGEAGGGGGAEPDMELLRLRPEIGEDRVEVEIGFGPPPAPLQALLEEMLQAEVGHLAGAGEQQVRLAQVAVDLPGDVDRRGGRRGGGMAGGDGAKAGHRRAERPGSWRVWTTLVRTKLIIYSLRIDMGQGQSPLKLSKVNSGDRLL